MNANRKAFCRRATCIVTLITYALSPSALGAPIADATAPIGFRPQVVTA
jgi:hypothetical protein